MTKKEKKSENFNVLGIDVGGTFTDLIYVDKENNIKIENAILNKAKKLRLQSS